MRNSYANDVNNTLVASINTGVNTGVTLKKIVTNWLVIPLDK